MSEVHARGRGRASRGGFSSRGGRGGRGGHANGDKAGLLAAQSTEDEGEIGQLKKQYGSKVALISEMFPDWTDADIVFALQETDGDLEQTVERITDGSISQWGEVSKNKKDRSRSKAKEAKETNGTSLTDTTNPRGVSRGGRADRGGRGRGSRGRGASAAHTNGSQKENVTTTAPVAETSWEKSGETPSWDTKPTSEETPDTKSGEDTWGAAATTAVTSTVAAAAKVASSVIPDGSKKSWASMFAKKPPAPVAEKVVEPPKTEAPVEPPVEEDEPTPEPVASEPAVSTPIAAPAELEPEPDLTPSKDELTEDNLEQVPDTSAPAPTATAASTAASSWDPRSGANSSTPYSALQSSQPQAVRPPTSGYQASALKATGGTGRSSSYQRRVLDQEEAVRMPGNREVDRAAVQFGAFNLNGSGDEDVDGDREEAETRAQPPQHSPVAPRAALPPAPPQQPVSVPETIPTPPKHPTGLPSANLPPAAPGLPSPAPLTGTPGATQTGSQGNAYSQYSNGRYPQPGAQDQSLPQKPYDAFSQQAPSTQSPFDGYPHQQSQAQPGSQPQSQSGAFSSAQDQYSAYYTADPQQRNAYNNYYNQHQYGQQGAQGQDGPASQQRSYSGYAPQTSDNNSQFPQSSAQQMPSRYATAGEGQNSGHSTPNPAAQAQQPGAAPGAQSQTGHQQQPQGPGGNFPYGQGHPYYNSPYYASYMNSYGQQQYGAAGYPGGPYGGGKPGLHQQYSGYGMSPGAPYEHAASPAAGGFGASALHGRDSAPGGLSDYGRAGSAQSAQTPGVLGGSGAFGGHDAFGRGNSYQGQGQQHYSGQQGAQQSGDDLKPFGDSKTANGPSPSLSQAGRPGSAANNASGSALPPPQSQQGGYGGYPSHLQQGQHSNQAGSQYGQAGGQGHQNSQYGYGGQAFGNYYGNSQQQNRGGWGGNYGSHN